MLRFHNLKSSVGAHPPQIGPGPARGGRWEGPGPCALKIIKATLSSFESIQMHYIQFLGVLISNLLGSCSSIIVDSPGVFGLSQWHLGFMKVMKRSIGP